MALYKSGVKVAKIYALGSDQTFNIKTLVPEVDYTKLTVDDFYMTAFDSVGHSGYLGPYTYFGASLDKSYDASTGILICRVKFNSNTPSSGSTILSYGNIQVYLILGIN